MSHHEHGKCREIYCKTITAKGRYRSKSHHKLQPDERATHILGCWVINSHAKAKVDDHKIHLKGSYEIDVWYAYDDNQSTGVVKEIVHFDEPIRMHGKQRIEDVDSDCDLLVRTIQQPTCLRAGLEHGGRTIEVIVELEYAVDLVSEAKICVMICDSSDESCADDDDWDDHDEGE